MQDLPEFKKIVKIKWRVSLILTLAMLIIYFGFILLIAFNKPFLATRIGHNMTLGLPVGIGVLVSAWILTGIYTYWANRYHDSRISEIKKKISQ
ncbi:MAG TPA: DUF485 domain-containing protein [Bacteroidales bacterium]|jgi:uncharacterized membrane protein (DUF485 family)|nr:DUF485 domain-containing protein [Bacteroidales bacterium]